MWGFYSECNGKVAIVDQVRILRHPADWNGVNQEWLWKTSQKANTVGQSFSSLALLTFVMDRLVGGSIF